GTTWLNITGGGNQCLRVDNNGKVAGVGADCGTGGTSYWSASGSDIYNNNGGSVGIGTTTPIRPLTVGASTGPQLALVDGSLTSDAWNFRSINGTLYLATSSASTYATSTLAALTFHNSGKVGIGTTSPMARLTVAPLATGYPFVVASSTGVSFAINNQGYIGIGNSTPTANIQITDVYGSPSIRYQATDSLQVLDTGVQNGNTFGTDTSVGTVTWNNPSKAQYSDDSYATDGGLAGTTYYLTAKNFGFAIPAGATISGVQVDVEMKTIGATNAVDNSVKLIKGGAISGTDKATGAYLATVDTYRTYGGSGDLWGNTLTPADVNASTFGVGVSLTRGGSLTYIDHIRMTVYYVAASTANDWLAGIDRTAPGSPYKIANAAAFGTKDLLTLTTRGSAGLGTTTPRGVLTLASSTASQLLLSDGGNTSAWNLRGINGNLYLATSSPTTFATSTLAALTINTNGFFGIGSTTPWGTLSVNPANQNVGAPSFVVGSSTKTDFIVTQGGLVGIGKTAPGYALDVNGDVNIAATSAYKQAGNTVLTASSTVFGTFVGISSAPLNTGNYNSALGYLSLSANTTGDSNTAVGYSALLQNVGGAGNSAVGTGSLIANVSGNYNAALGADALSQTTGSYNVGVGNAAGELATGSSNIFVGYKAGRDLVSGTNNIVIGNSIDLPSTSSSNMLSIGNLIYGTGLSDNNPTPSASLSTGNIGIGTSTPQRKLTVSDSSGPQLMLTDASLTNNPWNFRSVSGALYIATSSPTTFATSTKTALSISKDGLVTVSGSIVSAGSLTATKYYIKGVSVLGLDPVLNNYFFGGYVGNETMTGENNFAIGFQSLSHNTTGSNNVGIGFTALLYNTTGYENTGVGASALYNNLDGYNNTGIGAGALLANTGGDENTATGWHALAANTSGNFNSAYGSGSLLINTTGSNNTAFGTYSLIISAGSNNTALGYQAGVALSTGSNDIIIGNSIDLPSSSSSNMLSIGNLIYGTGLTSAPRTAVSMGYVGIATSTPQRALTVSASTSPQLMLSDGGNTNAWNFRSINGNLYIATSSPTTFATSSQSALTINTNGGVGIGTTTPMSKLDVNGGVSIGSYAGSTAAPSDGLIVSGSAGVGTANPVGALDVRGTTGITWGGGISGISAYGLVNIGTPASTGVTGGGSLFINTASLAVNSFSSGLGIDGTYASSISTISIKAYGVNWSSGSYGSNLTFSTTNLSSLNEAMRIDKLGNVGIGTISPGSKLDVAGTLSTNNTVTFTGLTAGNTNRAVCIVSTTGVVEISSGATCSTSSSRYKHDITSLGAADTLAEVRKLRPVSFVYNQDFNDPSTHVGFVAEEVNKIDPRLVLYDAQGLPNALQYENITAILAGAVQALDARTQGVSSAASSTSNVYVTVTGNVGIGTNTPSEKLVVSGNVRASAYLVPVADVTPFALSSSSASVAAQVPASVLTAGGTVDLYKLATYNLSGVQALAARQDALAIRVDSLEKRLAMLESGAVSSQSGSSLFSTSTLVSALGDLGVTVQNGIAQFSTLAARQFIATTDSNGTTSSASVTINTGNTYVDITNILVHPSTKVFVTFSSQVQGVWWVSEKREGGFKVQLATPQASDVSFDYFLVQTEGQLTTPTSATSSPSYAVTQGGGTPVTLSAESVLPPVTASPVIAASTTPAASSDATVASSTTATMTPSPTTSATPVTITDVPPDATVITTVTTTTTTSVTSTSDAPAPTATATNPAPTAEPAPAPTTAPTTSSGATSSATTPTTSSTPAAAPAPAPATSNTTTTVPSSTSAPAQ
ncbi:hypothetical protein COU19_00005, partial [Candidatus Kaiserbacteria bacterium CG10_big_fil_rev_8_21_14_0_10_56_12]